MTRGSPLWAQWVLRETGPERQIDKHEVSEIDASAPESEAKESEQPAFVRYWLRQGVSLQRIEEEAVRVLNAGFDSPNGSHP